MILVVLVVAVTWAVMAAVKGLPGTIWEGVAPILSSIALATGLSLFYQKKLWHRWLVQELLAKTPDLRGSVEGNDSSCLDRSQQE